ncbi:ImmA/IrrE family metallo-endopeptidase [Vibrio parahaemolyticus]
MSNIKQHSKQSAEQLLKSLDEYNVPVNIHSICKKLGVTYSSNLRFDKSYSGSIKAISENAIEIWVNPLEAANRQRFTAAHEIGHLINDILPAFESGGITEFNDTPAELRRDGSQDPKEYRANDFAANLLMPRDLVIDIAKKTVSKLKGITGKNTVASDKFLTAMAAEFKVSEQAMEIRLTNLGIF